QRRAVQQAVARRFLLLRPAALVLRGRRNRRDRRGRGAHPPPVRPDHDVTDLAAPPPPPPPRSVEPRIDPELEPVLEPVPLPPIATAAPATSAPIVLDRVSRWYGNVVAVNDISFSLGAGITGLLGPNGAGKTTILHLLAGLLRPSAGRVEIAGQTAWANPSIYRELGLVPEREAVHGFLTGR